MLRAGLRRVLHRSPLFDLYRRLRGPLDVWRWHHRGAATPPPRFKQEVVAWYGRAVGAATLVETGTGYGDMLAAQRRRFRALVSIELAETLARRAQRRFRGCPRIRIHSGDSALLLPRLLPSLEEPCIFWLDAHAMAGGPTGASLTAIREELQAILEAGFETSVLLIDDARLFQGRGGYPTVDEVRQQILGHRPQWVFEHRQDILRAHPPLAEGVRKPEMPTWPAGGALEHQASGSGDGSGQRGSHELR
jgi:hypothetical protein